MDCSSLNWDWAACVACSLPNTLTDNVEIRKLNMMFKKKKFGTLLDLRVINLGAINRDNNYYLYCAICLS